MWLSHFLVNIDFNKLEKRYTFVKQEDGPNGLYFKIKTKQTQKNIFIDANAPEQFAEVIAILKKIFTIQKYYSSKLSIFWRL